ncbi:MAG: hypothetical protein AUK47_20520 [Deltaproteobacteria bacterium CG2_30_63_29]|nr:MAG: hypothetical protein AUK47_20520 [Deltaproteobacteria bacterium CG2_30_63_29]
MPLLIERTDPVVHLEFGHGKANEIGRSELVELEHLIDELERSDARLLVSFSRKRTSRGTPIFVAGANVAERADWSTDEVRQHVQWQRRVLARLRHIPQFHVALVSGAALGWGLEFLIACDSRIATPEATFALPETGLGIVPGAGGTSELQSLIGLPQALRLGALGETIDAAEALRIGLVQEVVCDLEQAMLRVDRIRDRLLANSPTAVAAFKDACLRSPGLSYADRSALEARAYELCLDSGEAQLGREHFEDLRKGIAVPWQPRVRPRW